MHAAVGVKERNPGGKEELNKSEPYLKMCLPGDAGKGTGLHGMRGTETSGCQISTLRAGRGGFGWLARPDSTYQGPYAFDHYLLSGPGTAGDCRPGTFLVSPDPQKTCKALSHVRGFFRHAVLCSSSPNHPVTALSGYFPELLCAGISLGAPRKRQAKRPLTPSSLATH